MFGSDAVSFALGASPDHPANTTDIAHALHTVEVAAPHVVVLVVGDSLHTCGEWDDRDDLDLPGGQVMKIFLLGEDFFGANDDLFQFEMILLLDLSFFFDNDLCFGLLFGPQSCSLFLTTMYVLVFGPPPTTILFFDHGSSFVDSWPC